MILKFSHFEISSLWLLSTRLKVRILNSSDIFTAKDAEFGSSPQVFAVLAFTSHQWATICSLNNNFANWASLSVEGSVHELLNQLVLVVSALNGVKEVRATQY